MNNAIQIVILVLVAYFVGVYLGYKLRKAQEK